MAATEGSSAPTAEADGLVRVPDQSLRYLSVETVGSDDGTVTLRAPARIEFRDGAISEVGTPMAGRVVKAFVTTGDKVRPGDPLLALSCPDAAAARTALATAQAEFKEAQAAYDRQNRMLEEGVGIERDEIAAEAHLETVRAELSRAEATTAFIGDGTGAEIVLRASIAGIVLAIKATPGAAVNPGGDPLMEVGDPSALWIVADIPERELPLVREGSRATLELPTEAEPLEAKVVSIGSVVSSGLRAAPVRLVLARPRADLRPGMFGRVSMETASGGPTLPVEAVLIEDGRESIVYVAKDDVTFERRPVVVGRAADGRVRVLSGLSPGERVVVKGALLLDGSAEQLI